MPLLRVPFVNEVLVVRMYASGAVVLAQLRNALPTLVQTSPAHRRHAHPIQSDPQRSATFTLAA